MIQPRSRIQRHILNCKHLSNREAVIVKSRREHESISTQKSLVMQFPAKCENNRESATLWQILELVAQTPSDEKLFCRGVGGAERRRSTECKRLVFRFKMSKTRKPHKLWYAGRRCVGKIVQQTNNANPRTILVH